MAINIYLQIADGAWNSVTGSTVSGGEKLSESELKKLRRKQNKQALKKKQEQEKQKKKNEQEKEDNLDPDKLIQEAQKEPLTKAKEWVTWLEDLNQEWLEGQLLAYQVAKRRNKPLQQIRALKRCLKLNPSAPAVHEIIADWLLQSRQYEDAMISDIMGAETAQLNLEPNIEQRNSEFLASRPNSLAHRLAATKVNARLGNDKCLLTELPQLEAATIEEFSEAIKLLESSGNSSESIKDQARAQWPLATAFGAAVDAPPRVLKPLKTDSKK